MCGSSGNGTTPQPSPPPTTFSYTAADNSNAQRRQAQMVGSTQGNAPGTVLGAGATDNSMTPAVSAEAPGTGSYR